MSKLPFRKVAAITCLIALPVLADSTEDFFAGPKYLWADLIVGWNFYHVIGFSGDEEGQFTTGVKLNAGVKRWTATFEYIYDREDYSGWSGNGLLVQKNLLLGVRTVKPYSFAYAAAGIGLIEREGSRLRFGDQGFDRFDHIGSGSWFGVPIEAGVVMGTSVGLGFNVYANINSRIPLGGFYVNIPLGKSTPGVKIESTVSETRSDSREPKVVSMNKAYAWAVGGTLLPIVAGSSLAALGTRYSSNEVQTPFLIGGLFLIGSGLMLGPSLGEFYTGDQHYGWWGVGIRAGSAVVSVLLNALNGFNDQESIVIAIPGILPFLGSTVYSFVHTHTSVMKANEKIKAERFGFSPTLSPASNGGLNTGLLGWMKF